MAAIVSPTQIDIFTAVRSALVSFGLQNGQGQPIEVIRGQVNRVPEPRGNDFVVMWPLARERQAINIGSWIDVIVTGSIASNILTVTAVESGSLAPGAPVYGDGVTTGCEVIRQLSGNAIGGAGTYDVTPTADVPSGPLYCGTITAMQKTEVTIQADVHGPTSADNATRIATLWRDQFGMDAFTAAGIDAAPLYTSDPRQIPFENGEQQTEERWVVDLALEANVAVVTPMQFADQLSSRAFPVDLDLIPVP